MIAGIPLLAVSSSQFSGALVGIDRSIGRLDNDKLGIRMKRCLALLLVGCSFFAGCAGADRARPTHGLLGFPLQTNVRVEGYCPRPKAAYQPFIAQRVNGQKLAKPVRLWIDSKTLYIRPKKTFEMTGYEDAVMSKGLTWTGHVVVFYPVYFYPLFVPDSVTLISPDWTIPLPTK